MALHHDVRPGQLDKPGRDRLAGSRVHGVGARSGRRDRRAHVPEARVRCTDRRVLRPVRSPADPAGHQPDRRRGGVDRRWGRLGGKRFDFAGSRGGRRGGGNSGRSPDDDQQGSRLRPGRPRGSRQRHRARDPGRQAVRRLRCASGRCASGSGQRRRSLRGNERRLRPRRGEPHRHSRPQPGPPSRSTTRARPA